MFPNSQQLALRDPAAATLLGIIKGDNFGLDTASFGDDFSADFGSNDSESMAVGADFGDDFSADFGVSAFSPMGADFGDDFSADFAADAPTAQQLQRLAAHHKRRAMHSQRRAALLEPNKHSDVKVERYSFTLSTPITIGTTLAFTLQGNPSVDIRPQRVCTNVPGPNFVFLNLIQVANVVVTVGTGLEDANDYASNAVGTILDLPTLSTQTPARVTGTYTGFVPPAYVGGSASNFCTSFKGWANIVA